MNVRNFFAELKASRAAGWKESPNPETTVALETIGTNVAGVAGIKGCILRLASRMQGIIGCVVIWKQGEVSQ